MLWNTPRNRRGPHVIVRLEMKPHPQRGDTVVARGAPAVVLRVEYRQRQPHDVDAETEPACPSCDADLAWIERAYC